MKLDVIWTNKFKHDYKLAMKRHLDIDGNELVLVLSRTGTHSDVFDM